MRLFKERTSEDGGPQVLILKLAWRPWKLLPWTQISGVLTAGFLLTLLYLSTWAQLELAPIITKLENEKIVTVYAQSELPVHEEETWVDTIRLSVGSSVAHSFETEFIGITEFLQQLEAVDPTLTEQLLSLGSELKDVVPRYVTLSGAFLASDVEKIKKLPSVQSVVHSHVAGQRGGEALQSLRVGLQGTIAGLAAVFVVLMVWLVRMNSHLQMEVIRLLRLWGGSGVLMRLPGFISTLMIGLLGGLIAAGLGYGFRTHFPEWGGLISPLFEGVKAPTIESGITLVFIAVFLSFLAFLGDLVFPLSQKQSR
jgi:cell division protein FtsX